MMEAVKNHGPDVVVIDEIGSREVSALFDPHGPPARAAWLRPAMMGVLAERLGWSGVALAFPSSLGFGT
jgi:hypothetical protein